MFGLTPWRPMRDVFDISHEMDRMFDEFFDRWPARRRTESRDWDWVPPVDILEAEDHVELRAEVPGLSEKDVHVSITDNVLTVRGERKRESETKNGNYHRVERSYGRFQRSFTLPPYLQTDNVKATFKDGILTVSIPKAEIAKPKEIPIAIES